MERKLTTAADIIIIAAAAAVCAAFIIFPAVKDSEGSGTAVITVDGSEIMRLPLDKDTEVEIDSLRYPLTVTVKDGRAAVTECGCPSGICKKTGYVGRNGETVICLPNRLIIEIVSDEKNGADLTVG
ncbi:MAG: NusG domain II-containing protein [Oscillospiraceae bacterium]|nr:NusG domain II-containing protein [Oscillospiraceae bacterium]MBQ4310471.1 NusG domain II-containing protein [Oscillospiraceae bacterium]